MSWEDKYLNMMHQWLILKYEGKSIDRYLKKQNCNTVAVYGMAIYGRHVIRELQESDITVLYGIDRKKLNAYNNIVIMRPKDGMPAVDIIINTVIHEHSSIRLYLAELTNSPVISLEDIVFGSYD